MTRRRALAGLTALTIVLAVLIVDAPQAAGAVIYDNGGPGNTFGLASNGANEAADDFVLPTGQTTIRDVHWSGFYFEVTPPATDSFTANIYSDDSGVPGPLVTTLPLGPVSRLDSGVDFGTSDIFNFSATASPTSLTVGTTYWLSVVSGTTGWNWVDNGDTFGTGNARARFGAEPFGLSTGINLTFSLTDDIADGQVPEPSTLLLLGSSMIGLGWFRLRKR